MNGNLFKAGQSIKLGGGTATPKLDTYQRQNAIDAGFKSVRPAPPPPPRPSNKK